MATESLRSLLTEAFPDAKELDVSEKGAPVDRKRPTIGKRPVGKVTESPRTSGKGGDRPISKGKPTSKPSSKSPEPSGEDAADEDAGDAPSASDSAQVPPPQPQPQAPPRKLSPAELKKIKGKRSK